jgi:hypothetical protein
VDRGAGENGCRGIESREKNQEPEQNPPVISNEVRGEILYDMHLNDIQGVEDFSSPQYTDPFLLLTRNDIVYKGDDGYFISSLTIFADNKQSGIPPPGCTLPPQKYNPSIFDDLLACLKNAANWLLELVP